ncbi:hypothetical protein T05_7932 [Trichinella murrelli]|uniref:Uncharacterized protein n=1 Tax=Trichinella murrelli TaxID=144512 RepID=A0A0V0UGP3_9BILA|nr:hypothetical protein T05_7932 [Trichinella murrelli]
MYIRTVCTNDMNFSCYGQSFELLLIKLRLNAPILSILFLISIIAYATSLPKHSSKSILLTKQKFIQAIDSSMFKKEKYKNFKYF